MRKTVILTPVGASCNQCCDYCYAAHIREPRVKVMSMEVAEWVIKTTPPIADEILYLFHGGEPLLAGKEFYERVLSLQRKYSKNRIIQNHIQTNGTLINEGWANFLHKNNLKISVSLDGPKSLHDLHRKDARGKGSFNKTVQAIELLRRTKEEVGVVITVNGSNVNYPKQVYEALIKEMKVNGFEINPCSPTKEGNSLVPDEKKLADFLITVFNLWWEDDNPKIRIRLFENVLKAFMEGTPIDCTFRYNACRQFVAVDEVGDVYTCGRFLKEQEAYLGNIADKGMAAILHSKRAQKVYGKVALLNKDCQKCKWINACGGGCPYLKWLLGGWGSKFYLCGVRKKLFSHIQSRLQERR